MTKKLLYSQPFKPDPYLENSSLEEGKYELTVKSATSKAFTNIGRSVWMIARALDNDALILGQNIDGNIFEWDIVINTSVFNILMKCIPYKEDPNDITDCYVQLEFDGKSDKISLFAQFLAEKLEHKPFEIIDWDRFTTKTGVSKEEVLTAWDELLEQVIISPDTMPGMDAPSAEVSEPTAPESPEVLTDYQPAIQLKDELGQPSPQIPLAEPMDDVGEIPEEQAEKKKVVLKKRKKIKLKLKTPKVGTRKCPRCSEIVKVELIEGPIRFHCPACGLKGKFKRKKEPKIEEAPSEILAPELPREAPSEIPAVEIPPPEVPFEKPEEPSAIEAPPEIPAEVEEPSEIPEPKIPPEETHEIPEEIPPPEPPREAVPDVPPEVTEPEPPTETAPELDTATEIVKPELPTDVSPALPLEAPPAEVPPEEHLKEPDEEQPPGLPPEVTTELETPETEEPPAAMADSIPSTPLTVPPAQELELARPKAQPVITHAPEEPEEKEVLPVVPPTSTIEQKTEDELYESARNYMNQGKYIDAMARFDDVLETNPNHVDALSEKGVALWGLGRFGAAIECYNKAIELDQNNTETLINKGVALNALDKKEEAIASYDKAIEINERIEEAWLNKGVTLFTLNRFEEAEVSFNKATDINPESEEAWLNRAIILEKLERFKEALESYEKVLILNPDNPDALTGQQVSRKELKHELLRDWKL